jgi:type I restriction-modification system DNA methylase subunit
MRGGREKLTAPKEIIELVERFENNLEEYRSGRYNETELRRDFVDPFFKALGWDVGNKGGRSELYREVVHEDSVKVRGSTKAPDYGFYVGGARKFFVEAKKPSVNLENDVKAAFQLRSYAWSAGLSISLLTDFEEFSIYDCRIEPANSDSPKVALLRHFTYDKYIDHWDQIAALFSREAVLGGSLERFIESRKRKKGTIAVDEAFLREIDHWREILAKNVHKNNLDLTVRELNSSVQNTIDRIVFLRICEDRGIERDERLKDLLKGERAIYTMLVEQFRQADEKYNSGLFHFKKDNSRHGEPDELALGLKIDDAVLSEIIENLYPPKSPYRFSVIPAEILGHVYEQFLGKVIRLGDDGDVEVEYKPEVRKAGGVYYTPTYIVDYIVENTVGKLLAGATPTTAADLRILDPACGSGSFLIGAYQKLLDWHLEWYADHLVPLLEAKKPETSKEVRALLPESYTAAANGGAGAGGAGNNKKRGRGRPRKSSSATNAATAGQFPVFQAGGGEWRLTTAERKRILLNNIHGVDIDLAAVEVTKLSLQLKVLEGENVETLSKQLTLFHERALPDLGENIKCGNSLIGPDFYDRQTSLFDEEEMYRVNAFDWEAEFPEIMGRGGFDAVIGNPPWGAEFGEFEKTYFVNRYSSIPSKTKDSYLYFFSRAIDEMLNDGGFLGFIVPNTWLLINNAKEFREKLLSLDIVEVIDHGDGVFKKVTAECVTIILVKSEKDNPCRAVRIQKSLKIIDHMVDKQIWLADEYSRIIIDMDKNVYLLLKRLRTNNETFGRFCEIIWGIKPYQVGHGTPPQTREMVTKRVYHSSTKKDQEWKPLLVGSNVNRYKLYFPGEQFIKYGKWLMYPSNETLILQPKILMRQTSDIIRACYDDDNYYPQNSVFIIHSSKINLKYLLGLLNSTLLNFAYKFGNPQTGKIFAEIKPSVIKQLPIHVIDFSDPADVARHDQMVSLVERMLDLNKRLLDAKTSHEKTLFQRQIETTDKQIDRLVYELYGLTEEEIAIVEDAAR